MVRVEAPPKAPPTSPSRDPTTPWLAVVASFLLITGPFPWERWCDDGASIERCFSAPLWGGSGSLLGFGAILLILVFLLAAIRTGLRSDPGSVRIALFAGILATVMAKWIIVMANGSQADNGLSFGPANLVTTIGILATVVGLILLLLAVAFRSPRRRPLLGAALGIVFITVVAIPYAQSGLAWWGGPLAEPPFLGGGNGVGYVVTPGQPALFDGLLYVHDLGRVGATLDGLDLVDPSGHINVRGTYVIDGANCTSGAVELPVQSRSSSGCAYPLEGFRIGPGNRSNSVLLAMLFDVPRPGVYRSGWFRIRYHVGPLKFEVFRTDQLVICAPEPGKRKCAGDGL